MHGTNRPRGLTRRRMALALPLLGAAAWLPSAGANPHATVLREGKALMGTQVSLVAEGESEAVRAAVAHAWRDMERLAALMTRYEPGSAVSAINRAAGRHAVPVPAELMAVLQSAQSLAVQTGGAFDATVGALQAWHFGTGQHALPAPADIEAQRRLVGYRGLELDARAGTARLARRGMALDLGGIAKLPILEAGMETLKRHGIANALLNGGGDVLVAGQLRGRPWRVGLRDPRAPERVLGVLALQGQAIVASSGDYERFFMAQGERQHHILDPATGRPTHGPHGVSLLASDAASVNGLGAAMMVLGSEGARALLRGRPQVQALVAERDQRLWRTPGMAAALQAA
ncbi:thiamine biosynthesis protein ApbE [Rhodococcus sp. SRB_17]|nr:thiamine biosynthesis protein ApbE [Rhodococcus sp. SRB_17]